MGAFKRGDVVFAEFPFSSGNQTKSRPVLVILPLPLHNDYLVCPLTMQDWDDPDALLIQRSDVLPRWLPFDSYVRSLYLVVKSAADMDEKPIGQLLGKRMQQVMDKIRGGLFEDE